MFGPGMVVHASDASTREVEAGGSGVQGQGWLYESFQGQLKLHETLSQLVLITDLTQYRIIWEECLNEKLSGSG